MKDGILLAITVLSCAFSIFFAYKNLSRNEKGDSAKEGEKSATVLIELGYIKSGVDDIKKKQETQDNRYIETVVRLTDVESSVKQAHKRIDAMEGRQGGE